MHRSTVSRILKKYGLVGRVAARKLILSREHARRRLRWCRQLSDNSLLDWNNVMFSDESAVMLRSNRRGFVRRPVGQLERYKPKYLSGSSSSRTKSLMVWGAIWSTGFRRLVRVVGNMDSKKYIAVLKDNLLPYMTNSHLLQQDNASCHTSEETFEFMASEGIAVLPEWPARSPDLNIIENLWKQLKDCIKNRECQNLEQLWTLLETAFYAIPDENIVNLYKSLPNRVKCIVKVRGMPIKY